MFRKRVLRLSRHNTTEAKMTSEQKRGKSEKKAPLKQTISQTKQPQLSSTHTEQINANNYQKNGSVPTLRHTMPASVKRRLSSDRSQCQDYRGMNTTCCPGCSKSFGHNRLNSHMHCRFRHNRLNSHMHCRFRHNRLNSHMHCKLKLAPSSTCPCSQ